MLKIFRNITIFIIIAIILIYSWYIHFLDKPIFKQEKIITINRWDTFLSLANKLNLNKFYYKIYLNKNKPNFDLQAWKYKINSWATIKEIIKSLDKPALVDEIKLTFLEWWNIYDIDDYLTKKWLIKKWDYIKYTTSKEKILKLSKFYKFIYPEINTLEWYLYPDTYKVDKNNFWINKLVIKQLDNFEEKVYNKILKKYSPEKIQEILKLASIVEKEEKSEKNKPIVAWILKKRLNNSWPIWADITVCYPHKLTSEQCKMVISKYIREKNEYNTRTMVGLTKTPIWNPSFETISATINDKKTPYWYYLHDTKTWQIYYATDNLWHEQNKRLYLR
jgi:UPF0755 protein